MSTTARRVPLLFSGHAVRLLTAAMIVLAAIMPIVAETRSAHAADTAVTTDDLNLRGGPSTDQPIRLVMPAGSDVEILDGPRRGFYKVSYNGNLGWAHGDYLDFNGGGGSGDDSGSTTVLSDLNLRSGASTSSSVILVMPEGATVDLTGESSNGFRGVVYRGTWGWAYAAYLDIGNSAAGDDDGSPPTGSDGGSATVDSALNLRSGPSTDDSIILVMPGGADIELTGDAENGFLGVIYNGTRGWAFADFITTGGGNGGGGDDDGSLPTGDGGESATVDSALNLRSGPSTNASIILVMPGGADIELTGDESNNFLGVIYNGTRGWAYADYITVGGGGNNGGGGSGSWDGSDGWSQDEIIAIIYAAADYWGQSRDDMLRVATCESGLDPYNVTPPYDASGLFQFLPGTWASTPYADQDIFDPVANANATGWMWSVGRRGEWVCQ